MRTVGDPRLRIDWLQTLCGGTIIAVADVALAVTYWFSWNADGLTKLFQVIASGVLGSASKNDGALSALLGAGLHLFMATMFVVVYALASRRWPRLLTRPVAYGVIYGVGLFLVMNFVVVPLSRTPPSTALHHVSWVVLNIGSNLLFGIISVAFSRRATLR